MEESEFGTGFIYCLVNFAKHFDRLSFEYENAKKIGNEHIIKHVYSLWINGASDHLYELQIPKELPEPLKKMALKLQDTALDLGHGSGLMTEITKEQIQGLRGMLNALCLEIDRWLKVKIKEAQWD